MLLIILSLAERNLKLTLQCSSENRDVGHRTDSSCWIGWEKKRPWLRRLLTCFNNSRREWRTLKQLRLPVQVAPKDHEITPTRTWRVEEKRWKKKGPAPLQYLLQRRSPSFSLLSPQTIGEHHEEQPHLQVRIPHAWRVMKPVVQRWTVL